MADMNYILKNPRKVVRCVDKNERERQVFRWRNKAARHLKLEV